MSQVWARCWGNEIRTTFGEVWQSSSFGKGAESLSNYCRIFVCRAAYAIAVTYRKPRHRYTPCFTGGFRIWISEQCRSWNGATLSEPPTVNVYVYHFAVQIRQTRSWSTT